jgi:dinuclear metal center YbgI/SA1388 family protein
MTTVTEITQYLESIAPPSLQESYDNSGLLLGNPQAQVQQVLICLDVTEAVIEEAIAKKCQLIIAHHPLIFGGLKSLTGKNWIERTVIKAIKNQVAIYALHTNLDNIQDGVNAKIAQKLGIAQPKILAPKTGLLNKLVVFVPHAQAQELANALFSAGAGRVGEYDECSFAIKGEGSFRGSENSQPTVGLKGQRHYEPETRQEFLVENHFLAPVLAAMHQAHPYEEVAYDVYALKNKHQQIGAGMVGLLPQPVYALDFLKQIKNTFGGTVRYTSIVNKTVQKIAWCGGSGSFLLEQAIGSGADVFLTSDFKYHQFFEAEGKIQIADIGHYENEQFTKDLIAEKLSQKFSTFAPLLSETNTNPINYL